jgi:glycosyltransferase involved in cell wall biosynthesis
LKVTKSLRSSYELGQHHINKEIIEDGVNGFLVYHQSDWQRVLENVLMKKNEFEQIGERAAQTIKQNYSYEAHINQYLQVIDITNHD